MTNRKSNDDRLVDYLRSAITDGSAGLNDVPALLKRVIEEDLWRERFVQQSKQSTCFPSFKEFVEAAPPEGLGTNLKTLQRLCADEPEILELLEQMRITAPARRGGDRRSAKFKRNNVPIEKSNRGNSSGYSMKRLHKHSPALYQKVLDGEITINQAMIAANLRQTSIYITKDIEKTAQSIRMHFTEPEIARLIKHLSTGKE
jgi:hypothetical protein